MARDGGWGTGLEAKHLYTIDGKSLCLVKVTEVRVEDDQVRIILRA